MFEWIRKLFSNPQPPTPPPAQEVKEGEATDVTEIYSVTQRNIYCYFDGNKKVYCDPIALWKRLMDNGPELSIKIKVAFSQSKGNIQAHTQLVEQVREAFGVKPFRVNPDGTSEGLTEVETVDLLNHFLTYVGGVKKNSSGSPTTQGEGTSHTSEPPSEGSPPTENGSDSGSTGSGPSSDTPGPSPSGPA